MRRCVHPAPPAFLTGELQLALGDQMARRLRYLRRQHPVGDGRHQTTRTSSATLPGPATTWQPHCPQHWQERHREQRDEDIDYDRKLLQGAQSPAPVGGVISAI